MLRIIRLLFVAATVLVLGLLVLIGGRKVYRHYKKSSLLAEAESAANEGRPADALKVYVQYPDDPEALYQYAVHRRQVPQANDQHIQSAREALERCTDLKPDHAAAWLELARCYRAQNDLEGAARAAKLASKHQAQDEEANVILISSEIQLGNYEEALQRIEQQFATSKARWHFALLLSDCLDQMGEEPPLERVELLLVEHPEDEKLHLVLGGIYLQQRDQDKAEFHLAKAIEALTDDDLDYARCVMRQAMSMEDLVACQIILDHSEATKKDPFLSLVCARRLSELGRWEEVSDILKERELSFTTEPEAVLLLAMAAIGAEQPKTLKTVLAQCDRQQNDSEIAMRLAALIRLVANADSASPIELTKTANRLAEIFPNIPMVGYLRASGYFNSGEFDLAATIAESASRQAPKWLLLRQLVITSHVLGDAYASAFQASKEVLRDLPNSVDALLYYNLLQATFLKRGDAKTAEALLNWTAAVKLPEGDPRSTDFAIIRYLALQLVGTEEASEFQRQSLPQLKNLDRNEILRHAAMRRFRAAGTPLTKEIGSLPTDISTTLASQADQKSNNLSAGGPQNAVSQDANATSQTMVRTLSRNANESEASGQARPLTIDPKLSREEQWAMVRKMEAESPEHAIRWRVFKARLLLSDEEQTDQKAAAALLVLRPASNLAPESADVNLLMGIAFLRLGDLADAVNHLRSALKSRPDLLDVVLRITMQSRVNEHWDDAGSLVDFWTQMIFAAEQPTGQLGASDALDDQGPPNLRNRVVYCLRHLAEFSEQTEDEELAEALYRELLSLDSSQHAICNNLAMKILERDGPYQEALDLAKRAVSLMPDNEAYQDTLDQVQAAAPVIDEAQERRLMREVEKALRREAEQAEASAKTLTTEDQDEATAK